MWTQQRNFLDLPWMKRYLCTLVTLDTIQIDILLEETQEHSTIWWVQSRMIEYLILFRLKSVKYSFFRKADNSKGDIIMVVPSLAWSNALYILLTHFVKLSNFLQSLLQNPFMRFIFQSYSAYTPLVNEIPNSIGSHNNRFIWFFNREYWYLWLTFDIRTIKQIPTLPVLGLLHVVIPKRSGWLKSAFQIEAAFAFLNNEVIFLRKLIF